MGDEEEESEEEDDSNVNSSNGQNNRGGGLKLSPPDVMANISDAKSSLGSQSYSQATKRKISFFCVLGPTMFPTARNEKNNKSFCIQ